MDSSRWSNWDTWAASLWLNDNDEETYRQARHYAVAAEYEELQRLIEEAGNFDGIDFDLVNWAEVAEHFL